MNDQSAIVETQIKSFMDELEHHPVYQNEYFKFLQHSPWNRDTYDLHRANFFYRTELTVKGIAHVCARAAQNDDQATLILFAYILNEETGNGSRAHCHEVLMENSHNLYGEAEFGSAPLLVKEAKNSGLIIDETEAYRARLHELLSGSYNRMLGVVMALESHADKMLHMFRDGFRANRKKLHTSQFVDKVEVYFNVHVGNGVEERHASDARQCVVNNCRSDQDMAEIVYGAKETLAIQHLMWDALYKRAKGMSTASRGSIQAAEGPRT